MTGEISFDLRMEDNMSFVEGSYKLPDRGWEIFVFTRKDVAAPVTETGARWDSGVTGTVVRYPKHEPLNKSIVMQILATALGVTNWTETSGPDSMQLR